jgi:hypothetical protein
MAGNCIYHFPETEEFHCQNMWGSPQEMDGQCEIQIKLRFKLNSTYEIHRIVAVGSIMARVSSNDGHVRQREE